MTLENETLKDEDDILTMVTDINHIFVGKETDTLKYNNRARKKSHNHFFSIVRENGEHLDFETTKKNDRQDIIIKILETLKYDRAHIVREAMSKMHHNNTMKIKVIDKGPLQAEPVKTVELVEPVEEQITSKQETKTDEIIQQIQSESKVITTNNNSSTWTVRKYKGKGHKEKQIEINNVGLIEKDSGKITAKFQNIEKIL